MPIRLADLAARLNGVKWSGDKAFTALCPAHQDSNSSFSARLAEDGKLLCNCFAGCSFPAIVAAFGLEERDFFPPKPAASAGPSQKKRREAKPITLAELAATKKFDIAWLREHGVEDFPPAKGPGVAIGYFREDQSQHARLRRRVALRAKDGSDWIGPKDVPLIPYGLWLLSEARRRRFLVIGEGECLTGDAEVLTPSGWRRFDEYDGKVPVAQWSWSDKQGVLEFIEPSEFVVKPFSGDLCDYRGNGFRTTVTPGHRIPLLHPKTGELKIRQAGEGFNSTIWHIPRVGRLDGPGILLTNDELALTLAISADAAIHERVETGPYCFFDLKKLRKIERLCNLLDRLGLEYRNDLPSPIVKKGGAHQGQPVKRDKSQGDWRYIKFTLPTKYAWMGRFLPHHWLGLATAAQREFLLSELVHWDGNSVPNRDQHEYSSKHLNNAVWVQTLAHTTGQCSTIMSRKNALGHWFKVSILHGKTYTATNSLKRSAILHDDKVYCVTVPSGMFLVRQHGCITVTGNTDCWALWAHGWPALGLPGASNIRCLEKEHIRGLDKLYVIQESDKAGTAFPSNIAKWSKELGFAGEMLAVRMPSGAKDPCDLHITGTFDQEFQWAFENAQPIGVAPQAPQRVDCIIAGSDLEVRTQATFAAIATANMGPELFSNSTELVLLQDATAVPANIAKLRQWLTAHINFQTYDRRANLVPMTPPEVLVQNIMVYRPGPLPHLTRVVRRPVFAMDGRLIVAPGYDSASGLFYAPSRELAGISPGNDVNRALALIADLICDFNFETPSDRAHFYAFLLQPIFRELISGPTPIYRFEAPTAGTGKGRLFAVGATIHGGYVFTTPHGNNEEEWAKSLLTHLRTNPEILLIDNCSDLNSDSLNAATTAWPNWTARALSTLDQLVVPVRTLWAVTINNPQLREDVYRRTARIRIVPGPGIENPSARTNFRHNPLLGYLQDHLSEFVSATLTLATFAKEAMRPFIARTLGSYEEWARVMGGVVGALGIEGFLEAPAGADLARNREDIIWREFIALWHERYGSQWMRCKNLLTLAQETEMDLGKGNERSQQTTLGNRLSASRGGVFGKFLLDAKEQHHTLEYRSVPVENT